MKQHLRWINTQLIYGYKMDYLEKDYLLKEQSRIEEVLELVGANNWED